LQNDVEGIMNEQANIDVVRQCYDALKAGDIQRMMSYFADDVDWDIPEVEGIPFTGKRHGRDQVAQFFELLGQMQESRGLEVQDCIAQGDKVVAIGHYAFTVKSTGLGYEADWASLFTVENGKVTRFKEFTDRLGAAMAYHPGAALTGQGTAAGTRAPPMQ
jgi:ketosteroid isomerase-like protein